MSHGIDFFYCFSRVFKDSLAADCDIESLSAACVMFWQLAVARKTSICFKLNFISEKPINYINNNCFTEVVFDNNYVSFKEMIEVMNSVDNKFVTTKI